jgi:hypothetical protein
MPKSDGLKYDAKQLNQIQRQHAQQSKEIANAKLSASRSEINDRLVMLERESLRRQGHVKLGNRVRELICRLVVRSATALVKLAVRLSAAERSKK